MARLFGTDGVRGIANAEITCELACNIGRGAAMVICENLGKAPTVLVGTDTRISKDMLTAALNAGLTSVGAHCINLGVVPTPAVAYLVQQGYGDLGIMISASHNPYDANGIKIFGSKGYKLTEEEEFSIEKIVLDQGKPFSYKWGKEIGTVTTDENLVSHYVDHLLETVEGVDFSGLHVLVDCANGSAYRTVKMLTERLNIRGDLIHHEPDGVNINKEAGSTNMTTLAEKVKANGYDAGIAFDGDADRCLLIDETGTEVNGDQILAVLALNLKKKGRLKKDTMVATMMSNMGLLRFAQEHEIQVETAKVGDRYVLEKMVEGDYILGGEQSGHLILREFMTTGDGQLTALHFLAALVESGTSLSQLVSVMTVYPQVLVNLRANTSMKLQLDVDPGAKQMIAKVQEELGENGRVLVRPSGTEPLIRVMIEGTDEKQIRQLAEHLAEELGERLTLVQSAK